MNVPPRLYRITTFGCFALFVIYLFLCSDIVRADEAHDTAAIVTSASICAATNTLVSVLFKEPEKGGEYYNNAVWWVLFIRLKVPDRDKAEEFVERQIDIGTINFDYGKVGISNFLEITDQCKKWQLLLIPSVDAAYGNLAERVKRRT